MESVVVETFSRSITLLKTNLKWEKKFLEIKEELDVNREELQQLNGYDEVKEFLEANLMRFTGFKAVINLWEDLKKNMKIIDLNLIHLFDIPSHCAFSNSAFLDAFISHILKSEFIFNF